MPPAVTLTLSSDLASSISLLISVRMSRWASVTSRPMVGSSAEAGSVAMRLLLVVLRNVGNDPTDPRRDPGGAQARPSSGSVS